MTDWPALHRADPAALPADGLAAEARLLDRAVAGEALAHLWSGPPGLVAPRSYLRHAGFAAACEAMAARGLTVQLRPSGGGLVPQGPGLLNLSLAWPVPAPMPDLMTAAYERLCRLLQRALRQLDVAAVTTAVPGSFCDGRFNLALPVDGSLRKLAGTAQHWRRLPPAATGEPGGQAVLAHAVVIVAADPATLTAQVNAFEAMVGSGRQHRADALTSLDRHVAGTPAEVETRLREALVEVLAGA